MLSDDQVIHQLQTLILSAKQGGYRKLFIAPIFIVFSRLWLGFELTADSPTPGHSVGQGWLTHR